MFRTLIRLAVSAVAYAAARVPRVTTRSLMGDSMQAALSFRSANACRANCGCANRTPVDARRPAHGGKTEYG